VTFRAKMKVDQLSIEFEQTSRRKRRNVPDTSLRARDRAMPRTVELRKEILEAIRTAVRNPALGGATSDEIHEAIAKTEYEKADVRKLMEVRRRVSDLHAKFHEIHDTGARRTNSAGNPMIVWAHLDG
jgi:hypothetical protein